jgi:hypothetical protein
MWAHWSLFLRVALLLLVMAPCAMGFSTNLTTITPVTNDGTQFDRDTWNPTNGSFPAVGASYTDPIYGEVITRMRAVYPGAGTLLTFHNQWNADNTKFFWMDGGVTNVQVINTSGTQVETNTPGTWTSTGEVAWSPLDPNIYYYISTDSIMQRNIATDTTTTLKDFNLGNLVTLGRKGLMVVNPKGDTANPNNLLFLVGIGTNYQVYDLARDVLLTGSVTNTDYRWMGLSPDGKWLVRARNVTQDMLSVPIDVMTSTLGTGAAAQTGTSFWQGMCTDHGALVSLTSGKTYIVVAGCNFARFHYRVDISLNQTGRSTTLQAADALQLWGTDASGQTGNTHYSCALSGANQNWCWASNEDYPETAATPGTWYANKQEIMLVNMQTGKAYRMAHHRSYPLQSRIGSSPRVNSSQDATKAFFVSGMGVGTAEASVGYGDVYLISGLGPQQTKPWSRRSVIHTQ